MKPLKKELKAYRESDIALSLDEILNHPRKIAKVSGTADGCGYMRDHTEEKIGRMQKSLKYIETC